MTPFGFASHARKQTMSPRCYPHRLFLFPSNKSLGDRRELFRPKMARRKAPASIFERLLFLRPLRRQSAKIPYRAPLDFQNSSGKKFRRRDPRSNHLAQSLEAPRRKASPPQKRPPPQAQKLNAKVSCHLVGTIEWFIRRRRAGAAIPRCPCSPRLSPRR